jgi:hypothetical protein
MKAENTGCTEGPSTAREPAKIAFYTVGAEANLDTPANCPDLLAVGQSDTCAVSDAVRG